MVVTGIHRFDSLRSEAYHGAHVRTDGELATSRHRLLTTNVPETGVRDGVEREVCSVIRCRERGVGQVRSLTASLSAIPALNAGAFEAAMAMLSPVPGFAALACGTGPGGEAPEARDGTCSPHASASAMAAKTALTARFAVAPGHGGFRGHPDVSSALFMAFPLLRCARDWAVYAASNQGAGSSAHMQRTGETEWSAARSPRV